MVMMMMVMMMVVLHDSAVVLWTRLFDLFFGDQLICHGRRIDEEKQILQDYIDLLEKQEARRKAGKDQK